MPSRPANHKPLRVRASAAKADLPARDAMPGRKSKFTSDRRWRSFRAAYLAAHPLCQDCKAQRVTRAATQVHHVVKRAEDVAGEHWFDDAAMLALCAPCHGIRTGRGE
jgi:5-methylcytosine-specific restriction endonuclease McrA